MINCRHSLVISLFLFVTITAANAETYVFNDTKDTDNVKLPSNENSNEYNEKPSDYKLKDYITSLRNELTRKQNRCFQRFGSLHSTKAQLQECLDMIKKQKRSQRTQLEYDHLSNILKALFKPLENKEKNIEGGNRASADLTRLDNFADEYIDVNDLSRSLPRISFDYFDVVDEKSEKSQLGEERKRKPIIIQKYNLRNTRRSGKDTEEDNSEGDSDKDSDSSSSGEVTTATKKNKKYKFSSEHDASVAEEGNEKTRFQIVDHNKKEIAKKHKKARSPVPLEDTIEIVNDNKDSKEGEVEKDVEKKGSVEGFKEKYSYMQGADRLWKRGTNNRRRLKLFLPKRYHWNEDETRHLGYYWFNGPQGKYVGH